MLSPEALESTPSQPEDGRHHSVRESSRETRRPAALLRNIARAAGVPIYSDAHDVVYADRNYVGIYAPDGGTQTVHLAHRSMVREGA